MTPPATRESNGIGASAINWNVAARALAAIIVAVLPVLVTATFFKVMSLDAALAEIKAGQAAAVERDNESLQDRARLAQAVAEIAASLNKLSDQLDQERVERIEGDAMRSARPLYYPKTTKGDSE